MCSKSPRFHQCLNYVLQFVWRCVEYTYTFHERKSMFNIFCARRSAQKQPAAQICVSYGGRAEGDDVSMTPDEVGPITCFCSLLGNYLECVTTRRSFQATLWCRPRPSRGFLRRTCCRLVLWRSFCSTSGCVIWFANGCVPLFIAMFISAPGFAIEFGCSGQQCVVPRSRGLLQLQRAPAHHHRARHFARYALLR